MYWQLTDVTHAIVLQQRLNVTTHTAVVLGSFAAAAATVNDIVSVSSLRPVINPERFLKPVEINQLKHTTRSTGPRWQWLTESQTVLSGWSRRPYTSARKVHNPWIAMKAAINSVTHMTAFLACQVQVLVVPRTGGTSTSFFFWWRSLIETEMSTRK